MTVRTKLMIDDVQLSDRDESSGLYQFIVTFKNRSKARVFMHSQPNWHVTSVSRLLNVPCPICRKDYYCKCFDNYSGEIERQLIDDGRVDRLVGK